MKKLLQSYITFSKAERYGIAALICAMLILLAVRFNMHRWVQPPGVDAEQVVITTKKLKQEKEEKAKYTQREKKALPAGTKVNLNTADSLTLISLPGIGKGLSHRILQRRRELGKFKNMEQVFEVYKFKAETKQMLLDIAVLE